LDRWRKAGDTKQIAVYDQDHGGGRFDWPDRWFRTPVHWAVLNGNVPALEVLLEFGCNPMPGSPSKMRKRNRRTSARIETPIEMCERLYNCEEGVGLQIRSLLYTACDLNQGLSHKREKA